jgi:hypothetical protein
MMLILKKGTEYRTFNDDEDDDDGSWWFCNFLEDNYVQ